MSDENGTEAMNKTEPSRRVTPQPWQPKRLGQDRRPSSLQMRVSPAPDRDSLGRSRTDESELPAYRQTTRPRRAPEKTTIPAEPISENDTLEQMAAKNPEDIARALRTIRLSAGEKTRLAAMEQIAIVIIALGPELSSPVLNCCEWDEVEDITQAVLEIRTVLPERRKRVVEEFRQLVLSGDFILTGGTEYAQRMLQRAFPREWVGRLHGLIRSGAGPYRLFSQIDPRYIVPFVSKEHPQTIALILSQLDHAQSAAILTRLDPELQQDVAYRLATLDHVPLQTLRRLEEDLEKDLRGIMKDQAAVIGGPEIIAKILNQTSRDTEGNVMSGLEDRHRARTGGQRPVFPVPRHRESQGQRDQTGPG